MYNQPPDTETGGLFFKTAINQIFAGLYIEHLCLIGLFFLARDTDDKVSALPEAILMIILLVTTIFVQLTLNSGLSPLSEYLPLSMASEMDANEIRYAREMAEEKHQRRFQERYRDDNGEDQQEEGDLSNDTAGLAAGAGDMARQESGATAVHGDTHSEYHDAPGRTNYPRNSVWRARSDSFYLSLLLAGYVHTPQPMGMNEKPATYPPLTREKQGSRLNDGRNVDRDLEGGENGETRNEDHEDGDMDELEGGLGEHAFHHPALYAPQVSTNMTSRNSAKCLARLIHIPHCSPSSGYLVMSWAWLMKQSEPLASEASTSRMKTASSVPTRARLQSAEIRFPVMTLRVDESEASEMPATIR